MLTRRPEVGDVVDTPHGRGWLLYPLPRTERHEWLVLVETQAHEVCVDEMDETGHVQQICPRRRRIGTRLADVGPAGTDEEGE